MAKLGYIVPEFPGQTHMFFWREIRRLEELGVEVDIVSTRPPSAGVRSHSWSDEAERRTTYLRKDSVAVTAATIAQSIISFGVRGWVRCLRSILRAEGSIVSKSELAALAGFGASLGNLASRMDWQHMHVHSCANAANITAFASMLTGIPFSLTLHGALGDYGANQPEKWSNAKFGIVVTKTLYHQIEQELGSEIASKTLVAPMGVNLSTFSRHQAYSPWDGSGPARIYCVGRLHPGKGHDILIRALALLKARGLEVHLTIAGQDEMGGSGYCQTLKQIAAELGLADNVDLIGAVPEHTIRDGLSVSHVFALASLHEAIGVATMEAMAMGMPVIATRVGGVPELIDHGVNGILVSPGDPEELAIAIEGVLRAKDVAQRLAASSRQKIESNFQDTVSAEVLARNAGFCD
jgi:colanic acid/amylovoran biosynthesis glycosyltransferase